MPFAYARRIVTVLLEHPRERGFRHRQAQLPALLKPLGLVVAADIRNPDGAFKAAHPMLIAARQQRCPGRRALRRVCVALQKAHPLLADGIDIRGADVGAAVAADVAIAEIVGKDQDHVRTRRNCGWRRRRARAQASQEASPIQCQLRSIALTPSE
jgi:hypothetical protein